MQYQITRIYAGIYSILYTVFINYCLQHDSEYQGLHADALLEVVLVRAHVNILQAQTAEEQTICQKQQTTTNIMVQKSIRYEWFNPKYS